MQARCKTLPTNGCWTRTNGGVAQLKSFTAKDARDVKEKKSFTAKDAKHAEENRSSTAKNAKAAKRSIITINVAKTTQSGACK